jgi:hypothetical protein
MSAWAVEYGAFGTSFDYDESKETVVDYAWFLITDVIQEKAPEVIKSIQRTAFKKKGRLSGEVEQFLYLFTHCVFCFILYGLLVQRDFILGSNTRRELGESRCKVARPGLRFFESADLGVLRWEAGDAGGGRRDDEEATGNPL